MKLLHKRCHVSLSKLGSFWSQLRFCLRFIVAMLCICVLHPAACLQPKLQFIIVLWGSSLIVAASPNVANSMLRKPCSTRLFSDTLPIYLCTFLRKTGSRYALHFNNISYLSASRVRTETEKLVSLFLLLGMSSNSRLKWPELVSL